MCVSITALQCHYEVHQSTSPSAQCTHAQPHSECAQLDGLAPGVLPWLTGQRAHLEMHSINHIYKHWNSALVDKCLFRVAGVTLYFHTQVLRGDLKPAIETHEMLYQVTKQHKFLPEVILKKTLY